MKLPYLKETGSAAKREIVAMRGINYSDKIQDGDLRDSVNLSARRYPYISTRRARVQQSGYSQQTTAITAWGKLVAVDGTNLLYDGNVVGQVTPGEKQFAVVNTKLIIWPDKAYLDLDSMEFGHLDAGVTAEAGKATFTDSTITLAKAPPVASLKSEVTGYYVIEEGYRQYRCYLAKTYRTSNDEPCDMVWENGAWVLTGEVETRVTTSNLGGGLADGQLKAGDVVHLKKTDISGNYQLNLREYTCNPDNTVTDTGYAENMDRYYAKITSYKEEVVEEGGVHFHTATISYDVWDAGEEPQKLLSDIFKVGQPVSIKGSVFPYRNRENVLVKAVDDRTITFAPGTFAQTEDIPPLPDVLVTLESTLTADIGGFCVPVGSKTEHGEDGFPYEVTTWGAFSGPSELKAGLTVMRVGKDADADVYVYDPETGETTKYDTQYVEEFADGCTAVTGMVEYDDSDINAVTIQRAIPALDFICENGNRLWGASNADKTIYASALGDPFVFFDYSGVSTDSYAVAVGTEGDFTAACRFGSDVLFWKETKLHKVIGGYPAEYMMYTYDIEGIPAGCHKSLQIINETLFYMGLHGVYAFTGGTPSLVSENFGDRMFSDAVAGNDGDSYFLSAVDEDGNAHLMVYETKNGLWMKEDDTRVVDFARVGKELYFLDNSGGVWLADNREDDPDVEWVAQFTPFYETIEGRKAYSRILVRMELPEGSNMIAEVRHDGGEWKECGKVVGREHDVVPMRIAINRCDKFEIRLSGKGPCTILSVLREFRVRSDM